MRHVRRYNEAARGRWWRPVALDEYRRLADGVEADTFTAADVKELLGVFERACWAMDDQGNWLTIDEMMKTDDWQLGLNEYVIKDPGQGPLATGRISVSQSGYTLVGSRCVNIRYHLRTNKGGWETEPVGAKWAGIRGRDANALLLDACRALMCVASIVLSRSADDHIFVLADWSMQSKDGRELIVCDGMDGLMEWIKSTWVLK